MIDIVLVVTNSRMRPGIYRIWRLPGTYSISGARLVRASVPARSQPGRTGARVHRRESRGGADVALPRPAARRSEERELYQRTKRELAARRWDYIQDYADAKSTVVEEIISRAQADQEALNLRRDRACPDRVPPTVQVGEIVLPPRIPAACTPSLSCLCFVHRSLVS